MSRYLVTFVHEGDTREEVEAWARWAVEFESLRPVVLAAVAELAACEEPMTQREIADVLGVDAATVNRDVANATPTQAPASAEAESEPLRVADATDDEPVDVLGDETLALHESDDKGAA